MTQRFRLWWAKSLVRMPAFDRFVASPWRRTSLRHVEYMSRRPHRSFRRTRRRDYKRPLVLQGYWSFTWYTFCVLRKHKRTFIYLAVLYAVLSGILVGIGSQDTFNQFVSFLGSTNLFDSGWGNVGQAGLLFVSTFTGSISNPNTTGMQSAFGIVFILMLWLTTVWLLRAFLAGKSPRLRDGLYSSGSPIVAMMMVTLFGLVQLLPLVGAVFLASSLLQFSGVLAMLVWLLVVALVALSLYWLTSTFFAMIIVTLPGMYPWQALRTAGDLVIGRRIRVLFRLVWAVGSVVVAWAIVMIPLIALDVWIGSMVSWFKSIPIIPLALLVLSTLSLIWLSTYIYVLYRKVVDNDSAPA